MMSQDAQVCRRSWNRKYRIMISAIRYCRQRLQLATDAPTESLFPRSLGLEPKPPELLEGLRYCQWTDVNDDSRVLTPTIEEAFQVRGRDVVHVAVNRYIEERNERLDTPQPRSSEGSPRADRCTGCARPFRCRYGDPWLATSSLGPEGTYSSKDHQSRNAEHPSIPPFVVGGSQDDGAVDPQAPGDLLRVLRRVGLGGLDDPDLVVRGEGLAHVLAQIRLVASDEDHVLPRLLHGDHRMSPIARRSRFLRACSLAGVRSGTLAFSAAAKASSSASILAMVNGLILTTRPPAFFGFGIVTPPPAPAPGSLGLKSNRPPSTPDGHSRSWCQGSWSASSKSNRLTTSS